MNKVQEVVAKLQGIAKVVPCYEYGDSMNCTKQLTGRVFKVVQTDVYFEACSYHVTYLEIGNSTFEEVDLS